MPIEVMSAGPSRSFPSGDPQFSLADDNRNCLIIIGGDAGAAYRELSDDHEYYLVAVELQTECLAEHVGLAPSPRHSQTVGFACFRLGEGDPSNLVELVRQPWTDAAAIDAARSGFEAGGLVVATCEDFPGRIVDRLIRPYFNAVLRRLDERLASAEDMDTTLRLGLGYPEGPLHLLERTGLHHHFDVTNALYQALGHADYAPARRARVAKIRAEQS